MNHTWQIRGYREGDEKQILGLRSTVFGDVDPVRSRPSTWRWQFQDNPAGKAFFCLAEDKGAIVGQYAAIPTRFCVQGEEVLFAFSCDTMIHPGYRMQGMFSALANELYRSMESQHQITTVWGFPNDVSVPGFTKRAGWKILTIFPLRLIPIRPLGMILSGLPLWRIGKQKDSFSKDAKTSVRIGQAALLEPIDYFDSRFDELWERNRRIAPVMQVRDSRYLNWRYMAVPEFDYKAFAVWQGESLSGYMVIRMMDLMGRCFGVLVDMFPLPIGDSRITNMLIRFARDYCKSHGAEFLTCLLSAANSGFFKRAGLRKVPAGLNPKKWYFGCRHKDKDSALLGLVEHWYITYGDTDVV